MSIPLIFALATANGIGWAYAVPDFPRTMGFTILGMVVIVLVDVAITACKKES